MPKGPNTYDLKSSYSHLATMSLAGVLHLALGAQNVNKMCSKIEKHPSLLSLFISVAKILLGHLYTCMKIHIKIAE